MRRTKEDAAQTRERILDAAEQVFHADGVARTSLDQVARAAGVTRGAIYWHFRNKADLFSAVIQRVRMPMEGRLKRLAEQAETLDDLERLCLEAVAELEDQPRVARVYAVLLLKCEYTHEMTDVIERERQARERVVASIAAFFERMRGQGRLIADREPETLALSLHVFMIGLFIELLRCPSRCRDQAQAQRMVHYFFAPLKPAIG